MGVAGWLIAAGGMLAAALVVLGTLLAGTATANQHVSCGDFLSSDTTLDSDIGPCEGDGLIVDGDGVTLDLNGHRVFATDATNGPEDDVGIRVMESQDVTVRNGTVEGFDAGVELRGGGDNTVENITARENINEMAEPFEFVSGNATSEQPAVASGEATVQEWNSQMLCWYGDGITLTGSENNTVRQNDVVDNGPYGGITLVGNSDGNLVTHNRVRDNNVVNETTTVDGEETPSLCGATAPGAPGMTRGRSVQNIGIRVEGPNADNNTVESNEVDSSALFGITLHPYVCQPAENPGGPTNPGGEPNSDNVISNNRVRNTGHPTAEHGATIGDGIAVTAQGPSDVVCTSPDNTITGNTSMNNLRHGIALADTVNDIEVTDNVANNNDGNGVSVAEEAYDNVLEDNRAHNNDGLDGFDGNDDCGANTWLRNRFGAINQECVAQDGTGWVGGPGNSGNAPGNSGNAPGNSGNAPGNSGNAPLGRGL